MLREEAAGGPALPLAPVRGVVLVAFATFAGLHWMWLIEPAASWRAWEAVGIVVLVVLGLLGAARLPGALRPAAATLVALAAVALALLAGGVADEDLRPDRWSELMGGVGRGIESLPGVRVPYRGLDEWTRTVIGIGGTLLAALAALLAFWPRRGRTGFPAASLLALVTLYVVPAVVLSFELEFLRGALLALLLLAFLRLEKLRVRDAPAAGVVAVIAAIAALSAAPLLDGRQPWWDYESWALQTAGTRAVTFNWNHDYSPLDWPRDGRELLRVKARIAAYWKASDLDVFDGRTWRNDPRRGGERPSSQLPEDAENRRSWTQQIQVTLRNLRTDTFVTAGVATAVRGEDGFPIGGGVFGASSTLGRGDSYEAEVYTPQPTERQLAAAGVDYQDWLRSYTTVFVPLHVSSSAAGSQTIPEAVTWPAWGTRGGVQLDQVGDMRVPAERLLEGSDLARVWGLARELKQGAATPFDYIKRVEAYLADGFSYSERPPAASGTLDGFLFQSQTGFCQQFSGAEALLLRMAGIPARVATGFTSGSFDDKEKEYVVRDLDAHSWVEAWFPGYGWVTRDPTPAAAPPRSQPGDGDSVQPTGRSAAAPDLGGERLSDLQSNRARAQTGGTSPLTWVLFGVFAVVVLGGATVLQLRRRRRIPPPALRSMAEFERALRRARYDGAPSMTLAAMERSFSGWPGAAGYIRALREQRYSGRAATPTPEQRRGLRAALARDAGTLRAWWALPPRSGI
ncbi:MAG TPA: transglutaminaseTgpA domain-containing protein [Solirubrobacteraceae bacterium]|nr:transglutaminaseTgpA domain-containing protein [Solirubrobacteraceae bacterium]